MNVFPRGQPLIVLPRLKSVRLISYVIDLAPFYLASYVKHLKLERQKEV